MPSLMEPRMASGPMAKSNDALTKPSINGLSLDARKRFRRFSPRTSSFSSRCKALPINAPIRSEPRTQSSVQPLGNAEMYSEDQSGINALAAANSVTRPRMSVTKSLSFSLTREPIRTPKAAPPMMVATLIKVPRPGNSIRAQCYLAPLRSGLSSVNVIDLAIYGILTAP